MKEFVSVNVIQSGENLEQDALHARAVKGFVIPRLHELVEVSIHILHADVEFLGEWIKKDVQSGHEMGMNREGAQENHLAKLQTRCKGLKSLLHRLDCNLRQF